MKRKLLLIALAFSLVFSLSMAAGCKTVQPHKPCTHEYGDWIIDTDATCIAEGSRHHVCTICKNEETETIEAKGHTYGDWIIDTAATCTEAGSKHRVCTVCENNETETIAIKGHIYGEWITDTEATCTTAGTKHQNCKNCDSVIDGTIDATGVHTPGEDYVCTGCGAVVCPSEYLKTILTASNSVTLDKDYILTDNWTSLVGLGVSYTLNGGNHSISGLTLPLLGPSASVNINVSNLTIKDSDIGTSDESNAFNSGAFLATLDTGAKSLIIENCHTINVNVSAAEGGGSSAGSLVGYISLMGASDQYGVRSLSIKDCTVTGGSVTNNYGNAAGIVGMCSTNNYVDSEGNTCSYKIENCTVSGCEIKGNAENKTAEIVGTVNGSGTLYIEDCVCEGKVYGRIVKATIVIDDQSFYD